MQLRFLWDPTKARRNLAKHGIGFQEARTIFYDPFVRTESDPEHSEQEERFISTGRSSTGNVLVVIHTDALEPERLLIRIISSRRATRIERQAYEEE